MLNIRNFNISLYLLMYFWRNKDHKYFPDFKINDQLIEIKGTDLIDKETGYWIPFDKDLNKCKTEEEKQALLCQYRSKQLCAAANNVIVYTNKDKEIIEAISWVRNNKGPDFFKNCRKK